MRHGISSPHRMTVSVLREKLGYPASNASRASGIRRASHT